MTTEDLVRDTLAGLAPTAPADATAFAGVGRAITRRRRQRAARRVTAMVAVVLVAVGGAALATGRDDASPQYQSDGGSDDPTGTGKGAPESSQPQGDKGGGAEDGMAGTVGPATVTFGPATFQLPEGWEVSEDERLYWTEYPTDGGEPISHDYRFMCVGDPEAPEPYRCGVQLYLGDAPGFESTRPYESHGDWGWYHATDVMSCPGSDDVTGASFDGVQPVDGNYGPTATGLRQVGDKTADYDEWTAVCEQSGFTFHPRGWHLPRTQLVILDALGYYGELEEVLATFEFEGGGG